MRANDRNPDGKVPNNRTEKCGSGVNRCSRPNVLSF